VQRLVALALSALGTACIGVPPLRTAGQFGVSGSATDSPESTLQADVSLRPLGLFPELGDRKVDVGVGVSTQYASREDARDETTWLYGPTASIEVFPYVEASGSSYVRFVTGADVKTLYRPDIDAWGPAVAPKVGVELARWEEGCGSEFTDDGFVMGCWTGELGIGAYADGQVAVIEGNIHYSAGLSIAVRTPGGIVGGIPFPW
jgi:hypothetical protein